MRNHLRLDVLLHAQAQEKASDWLSLGHLQGTRWVPRLASQ